MSDLYLRSTSEKPQVISLRSQDQKTFIAVEPDNIVLSNILLSSATVSTNVFPDDLVLSKIILEQTDISGVIVPEDLVLSEIVLEQARQPANVQGTMNIILTGKAPTLSMQGAL